ncbi:MAG: TetR/AcrR family transcriptional regulator [Bacteroidetes bacterium]|nr:TetR/AcrR family transcriptional regulator [Bacteroidota bacterium]
MDSTLTETEQKILNAAKKVFVLKGMSGARMQEIANEAGINKSLLHYYFRTKEKLFDSVFQSALGEFFPKIRSYMLSDSSLEDKIKVFVTEYSKVLQENPFLPSFILGEVNRNPEHIISYFKQHVGSIKDKNIPAFHQATKELAEKGSSSGFDPRNLLLNMIGMILFPILARPVIKEVFFDGNNAEFEVFMKNRESHISEFIINSITKS